MACGGRASGGGITAGVFVLVTDADQAPVPGATVWIPADPAMQVEDFEGLALVDPQGNSCADPPAPALFAACTNTEGIALLPCGGEGVYLVNYFKDAASGTTNAECTATGVVPAPLDP